MMAIAFQRIYLYIFIRFTFDNNIQGKSWWFNYVCISSFSLYYWILCVFSKFFVTILSNFGLKRFNNKIDSIL